MMSLMIWLNQIKKMEIEEGGSKDVSNSIMTGLKGNLTSPAADCNSNNLLLTKENLFLYSTDSMHEGQDFLQDTSDYQWFLDYGYKDNHYCHQQSILSLSRSQDFYYEDMARNIDANLAEVDMDDFNREDIHSVLSTLPNIQGVEEREMFASVTGSMMVKFGLDSSISPHSSSQEDQNCTSICKSQLLFSPVRESYLPNTNLSVDSLDLSENDINLMVTCQANKNNYTIAFEGSTIMGSDDSESRDTGTSQASTSEGMVHSGDQSTKNQEPGHFIHQSLNAMACSDSTFTTWSKIKENSNENLQLRRHPSGNNNTNIDSTTMSTRVNSSNAAKSLSLPNLCREKLNSSSGLSTSVKLQNNYAKIGTNKEQKCMKLYDIQNSCSSKSADHSTSSFSARPNFSLVKLFIKQKSGSHDGMCHYAQDDATSNNFSSTNNKEQTEKENTPARNIRDNTMNILNSNNEANILKNKENQFITDLCDSKPEGQSSENFAHKVNIKKCIEGEHSREDLGTCHENKYYSDESTQENGSNTESAENLCNCVNVLSNAKSKKSVIEKSMQTSKLITSKDDAANKQVKVPVYILYPNYSLPNLQFLKEKHYIQNFDFSKLYMRPQKYQTPMTPDSSPKTRRPFSVNDIETLKKTGFKHIKDWESLTFLLPKEYKQFLQEIPEIVAHIKDIKYQKEELLPLFCLSPTPNRKLKKRPMSCDLNFFCGDSRYSNFSSTATQPSSGYRGSSTMLNSNNSNGLNSPRNTYRNDSSSESGLSKKNSSSCQSKNSFNHKNFEDVPPPRPPLPRGILRNNSLDNHQYTCKSQKENANKRYSMIELSDKPLDLEEKINSRKNSINNSKGKSKANKNVEKKSTNKTTRGSQGSDVEDCYYFEEERSLQNDMRRLEELLEISAVFGENVETFTEADMAKLRSQVSKFLTMHKNLEKVSETLQTVEETTGTENCAEHVFEESQSCKEKRLHTPHNTPEHKKQLKGNLEKDITQDFPNFVNFPGENHFNESESEEDFGKYSDETLGGMKKTVSFAEKISVAVKEQELQKESTPPNSPCSLLNNQKIYQGKLKRPVDLPIFEETESSVINSPTRNLSQPSAEFLHKRDLVLDVKDAVDKILKLSPESTGDLANLCLYQLCPSLYAVLSDGLKEEIDTPFGPIKSSVWNVIEASSQKGPMTLTLNELVQRLNRDDIFTEGLIKFNAFIFGLLNARALYGWLSYLRTMDSLLRKYYENSGLLLVSNTGGSAVRILMDQLINTIEPLCSMQFNLDLMYQTKLLHCSLQNLNSLLEETENNDFLTPTKQLMLLKLVQSIQNSICQEGKKGKYVLEEIEEKTCDPPVANLLEKNKTVRVRRGLNKTRPRSGYESFGQGKGVTDIAGAIQKRWSGVHLNSKLVEAFNRLGDDSESDYTDSLDNTKQRNGKTSSTAKNGQKGNNLQSRSKDLGEDSYTKEQKKNILLTLNKKSCSKLENCKTESEGEEMENLTTHLEKGGRKFKRLQQKWEKLSKHSDSDSETRMPSLETTPTQSSELARCQGSDNVKFSCDNNLNNLPSPTSRVSKIPRLISSPLASAPTTKIMGCSRKLSLPSSYSNIHTKSGKVNVSRPNSETKIGTSTTNRLSRCDDKIVNKSNPAVEKTHVIRPTSLPYRGSQTLPGRKNDSQMSRRASSMSLNRKTPPNKLQHVQRVVRTLTHRLPSDSGHLSFNEGEKLKVVLEVDKTWLLCCRGTQKGLVPKTAVISDIEDSNF